MAILAFLAAVFGPVVGAVIGFLGHALGDAMFYGTVWWSWVFPEVIVGVGIGVFAKKYAVRKGGFSSKNAVFFNIVQVLSNAVAWIIVASALDILVYAEPVKKVILQGVGAFLGNIVVIGILGTILMMAYSKVSGQSSALEKED